MYYIYDLPTVFLPVGGVTVDAIGTIQSTSTSSTSFNYTGITVGNSPNSALVLFLSHGVSANPSGITCVWDPTGANQSMSAIGGTASSGLRVRTYGLLSPVAGNKTLAINWTTADSVAAAAVSLGGVKQTSIAAAFLNQQAVTYTSTTTPSLSMTCTTPGTDMVLAQISSNQTISSGAGFNHLWSGLTWSGGYNLDAESTVAAASPTVYHWTLAVATVGTLIGLEAQWDGVTGAPPVVAAPLAYQGYKLPSNLLSMKGPLSHTKMGPLNAALPPPPVVTVTFQGSTLPMMGVG